MPIPSPFYEQTSALCRSHEWRDWAGYLAAVTYDVSHEHEYFAVRNAAALFDITPLFKYDITGPDAARLINRAITRDIDKCATAQVLYTVWCDDHGKIIDDGTVQRFAENHFRVTAAEPNFLWFSDCGYGLDVHIEDVTDSIAALSVQGPLARRALTALLPGSGVDKLGFFRIAQTEWSGTPLTITRTGY
ncbi:MAG TPA: aminomethyl transferase family protein, partial [Bacteroidetes bacterium]|nr:aminomethyl transferase family protein [Bacteroidota bacterium]